MKRKKRGREADKGKRWLMFVEMEVEVEMERKIGVVMAGKLEDGKNRQRGTCMLLVLASSWRRRAGMWNWKVGKPLRQLCWTSTLLIWFVIHTRPSHFHSWFLQIRPHLPALARLPRKWTLLYSLDQHGISLNTLYTRCEFSLPQLGTPSPKGALLVLKDAGDALFGVWMGEEGLRPSRGKGYYGSGECFMWKYVDGKFEVFKWTGRNDYVALCEPEYISFGGG
jgi:TLD